MRSVEKLSLRIITNQFDFKELTIVGTNGGFTFLNNKSSHEMCLKNACFLTSSASRSDEPSRRSGFLRSNFMEAKENTNFGLKDFFFFFENDLFYFFIDFQNGSN